MWQGMRAISDASAGTGTLIADAGLARKFAVSSGLSFEGG